MRKRQLNEYCDNLILEKSALRNEVVDLKSELKRAVDLCEQQVDSNEKLLRLLREERAPKFMLATFRGEKDGRRETFDAHVIEVGTGNSFSLPSGYKGIEVYVEEVNR